MVMVEKIEEAKKTIVETIADAGAAVFLNLVSRQELAVGKINPATKPNKLIITIIQINEKSLKKQIITEKISRNSPTINPKYMIFSNRYLPTILLVMSNPTIYKPTEGNNR